MTTHMAVDLAIYTLCLSTSFLSWLLYGRNKKLRQHLFERSSQDAELASIFRYAPLQEVLKKRKELDKEV